MLDFARGTSGCLRHGYQKAATLGRWVMRHEGSLEYKIEAESHDINAHWLNRKPLDLELRLGKTGRRVWHDVVIQASGTTLFIEAHGKPER